MLCFSRDNQIQETLKHMLGNPMTTNIKGKLTTSESVINFPPSGVIPFHGFTMYGNDFLLNSNRNWILIKNWNKLSY